MKKQHGRDLTGTEMAQILDEWVNSHDHGDDFHLFASQVVNGTHRTLQQGIMSLFMVTIESWAAVAGKGDGWYDARNEATIKLAEKIFEHTKNDFYGRLPLI